MGKLFYAHPARVLELGFAYLRLDEAPRTSSTPPTCETSARRLEESSSASVLDGGRHRVCRTAFPLGAFMSVDLGVGARASGRFPPRWGRVLLAFPPAGPSEIALLARAELSPPHAPHGHEQAPSSEASLDEVARARLLAWSTKSSKKGFARYRPSPLIDRHGPRARGHQRERPGEPGSGSTRLKRKFLPVLKKAADDALAVLA